MKLRRRQPAVPILLDLRAFDKADGDVRLAETYHAYAVAQREAGERERERMERYARQRTLMEARAAAEKAWIEQQKVEALKEGRVPDLSGNPFQLAREAELALDVSYYGSASYSHHVVAGSPYFGSASSRPPDPRWRKSARHRHSLSGGTSCM